MRNTHKTRSTRAPRWAQHQFNQEPTFEQVVEAADYAASLVGPLKALELPLLLGDDLTNAILAYREQAEGRKVHITPELRAKVDLLTEYLVEHSRQVDDEEEVQTAQETDNPLTEILLGLGVPEEIVEQAMNISVTVADYLTELVGDEDLALEVYDQLDPMYAPFAILAYRDQANGGETYLEPEVRKELDRLTEILAELSREQEYEEDEDDHLEFPDYDLPPEVKDRINRLAECLADAMSEVDEIGIADVEEQDSFDHYEDYRVNAKHWPSEDREDQDSEDLDEVAYERHQEDILHAARKSGGYVLATREVWAKPVAKRVDGRWIFETEYGLEYLDFEDYEFSPEFIDFEQFSDEETLTDLD
nr:MAG TPA: hypothetical protein [Caudoviricetes sp.]